MPAQLQGIYYAANNLTVQGNSSGNVDDEQLVVDGTLIGMGRVTMSRNNPGDYPAELVRFNPGYFDRLKQVGLRKKIIRELL